MADTASFLPTLFLVGSSVPFLCYRSPLHLYPRHGDFYISGWEGLRGHRFLLLLPPSPPGDCRLSFPNDWRNINHRGLSVTGVAFRMEGRQGEKGSRVRGLLTWHSLPLLPGQVCPASEKASWEACALG